MKMERIEAKISVGLESVTSLRKKKKKSRSKNKGRFSDEQIRLLETMFESETKPEPVKKAQLARELGLQPRQVAIWFQNRRARWKTKQIEQDYIQLKSNYDSLTARFESLKKEKQSLLMKLENLRVLLGNPNDHEKRRMSEELENAEVKLDLREGRLQNGDKSREMEQSGHEDCRADHPPSTDEHPGFSGASPEEWCSLESNGLLHHESCNSSQWWDFWI